MNISGFIGNIGDEQNIFKGTSDQTSELIITKAFISNGETLKTITARLKNKDIDIVLQLMISLILKFIQINQRY